MAEKPQALFGSGEKPRGRLFEDVLNQARGLMEAGEYSVAFGNLARSLDELAKTENIYLNKVQKEARRTLNDLWQIFIRDITSVKQKSKRLDALKEQTLSEVRRGAADDIYHKDLRGDPDASSKPFDEVVREGVAESLARIEEPFINDAQYMVQTSLMYNTVLPMLRAQMEPSVSQMIKNQGGLAVTPELIRARITAFLDTATPIVGILSQPEIKWEEVRDSKRNIEAWEKGTNPRFLD